MSEIKSHSRLSLIHHAQLIRSSKKLRKTWLPITALVFFVFALFFTTYIHVQTFISGYAIAQLERQQDELIRDLQALKLEEAVLKRPERIRKMAIQKLHLIPASKAPVIRLP